MTIKPQSRSVLQLMVTLIFVFFVSEMIMLFLLPLLPAMSAWAEKILSAGSVVLFSAPALYFLVFRSMESRIEKFEPLEEKLLESAQLFRQMAENIEEVFWMTDLEKNTMLYISPAYQKIWGRTCESLFDEPRNWLDAIHPKDRDRVLQAAMTKQARGDYEEEYRIVRPD